MTSWAVVLAGGIGARFWPLSTANRPKQLLALAGHKPLLAETLERLEPLAPPDNTLVLTNQSLVAAVHDVVPAIPLRNVIGEPRAGGTAAALTWAAQEIARRDGPDAVMLCVHADWAIGDVERFRSALTRARDVAAQHHVLVTVGVVPSRADPGLGYIQLGDEIDGDVRRVARFVEKPDRARAEALRKDGALWNSGIFVWRVGDFLDEVRRLTPEIAGALHAHAQDLARFFAAVTPISVDVGVLERSDSVVVLPGDFGWDDVGTWGALRRVRPLDQQGNAIRGHVHAVDARGNVVHAEGREGHGGKEDAVVLFGVSDLVVVRHEGLTLITTVERSSDLKQLIDALPRGDTRVTE